MTNYLQIHVKVREYFIFQKEKEKEAGGETQRSEAFCFDIF